MDDALLNLPATLKPARLLVLGDLMLDRTHWVRMGRLDPETSSLIAEKESVSDQPGGAAYVAALLSGFGNRVFAVGTVGKDAEGESLSGLLKQAGVEPLVVPDHARPTTLKERFVTAPARSPHMLMRIDRELTDPIAASIEAELCERLTSTLEECDGIIISDYAKGVCTPRLVATVISAARRSGLPVVVDPARGAKLHLYAGCDVITPNRHEAAIASGISIRTTDDAVEVSRQLCVMANAQACAITLDADGVVLTSAGGQSHVLTADPRQVVDTTGAGDAFSASLLHAMASGLELEQSARWANFVAGIQVERMGTGLFSLDDVHPAGQTAENAATPQSSAEKCIALTDLETAVARRRDAGERIVLTNGCFDLLHAGHVGYLEDAAAEGDCLIVAVNADQEVARLKGTNRPIMSQHERTRLLAALACVDHVVVFEEPTPHVIIRRIRPDVLVKGGDYAPQDIVGRELVETYGGTVKTLSLTPGLSTTNLLRQLTGMPAGTSHAG